jgi:hypothetical protein
LEKMAGSEDWLAAGDELTAAEGEAVTAGADADDAATDEGAADPVEPVVAVLPPQPPIATAIAMTTTA